MYSTGEGVSRDPEKAAGFLGPCCKRGDNRACTLLARLHVRRELSSSSDSRAFELFKKACKARDPYACGSEAHFLLYKLGPPTRSAIGRARKLYRWACIRGEGAFCYTLGFLLLRGKFFRRSELDGEWWINRACRLGHTQACATAVQRRLHRDYRLYRPLLQAAAANRRRCHRGNQSACVRLGIAILISRWLLRDKGFELPTILRFETSPYTLLTFQRACQKRVALACRALATLYYHGDMWVHQDVPKTLRFYEMACDLADARSCYRVGMMYYLADKTPHDLRRAIAAFGKGCALRVGAACYAAGFALSHGRKIDHSKAIGFYDKGCRLGLRAACDRRR